jgi:hypothetical protein
MPFFWLSLSTAVVPDRSLNHSFGVHRPILLTAEEDQASYLEQAGYDHCVSTSDTEYTTAASACCGSYPNADFCVWLAQGCFRLSIQPYHDQELWDICHSHCSVISSKPNWCFQLPNIKELEKLERCYGEPLVVWSDSINWEKAGHCCGAEPSADFCVAAADVCLAIDEGDLDIDEFSEEGQEGWESFCDEYCSSAEDSPDWCGLSGGAIAGIVIGVFAVVILIGVLCCVFG